MFQKKKRPLFQNIEKKMFPLCSGNMERSVKLNIVSKAVLTQETIVKWINTSGEEAFIAPGHYH